MSPSRQRLWQRQRIENGQCPLCSDPLNLYATLCDNCMAKEQLRKGNKPWEPGKPGRPPKNARNA